MNVDHFLKIGTKHKVCEDYIISESGDIPFVILSDGCSSSKNTDIGARILTQLTAHYLRTKLFPVSEMVKRIIYNAELIRNTMGLNVSCLDATLIVSYIVDDYFYVYMYGDGYLITVDLDNEISFCEISYEKNAPYYLSYELDLYLNSFYEESCPAKYLTNKFGNCTWEPYNLPFIKKLKVSDYKSILIASDGIDSFINNKGEKYGIEKVLKEVTSFKNTKGEFIKRRMGSKKGVINTFKKEGVTHYDDISIGGFIC